MSRVVRRWPVDRLRTVLGANSSARGRGALPTGTLALAALLAGLVVGQVSAAEMPYAIGGPGCIDRWVVSTHRVPPCGNLVEAMDRIAVWHREPAGWVPYSLAAFITALDSDVPVWFYVHGIFSSSEAAAKEAQKLFANVGAGMPPFRGVLWLWPADYQLGASLREQMNRAIANSRAEAFYLATILQSLGPAAEVQLVGHSFGCQIVCAALEALAKRESVVQSVGGTSPPRLRAALLAPTIDPCSLLPGGEFSGALSQVERMLVSYNPDDLALWAYEEIHQRRALGLRGLPLGATAYAPGRLLEVNASPAVSLRHSASVYFDSPRVAAWLRGFFSEIRP
jgi:hypothetical protein